MLQWLAPGKLVTSIFFYNFMVALRFMKALLVKTTLFYKIASGLLLVLYGAHLLSFEAVMFVPMPSTPNEHPIKDFFSGRSQRKDRQKPNDSWLFFFKHSEKEGVSKFDDFRRFQPGILVPIFITGTNTGVISSLLHLPGFRAIIKRYCILQVLRI